MKKKLVFSLVSLMFIIVSLFSFADAAWWDKFGEPQYGGSMNIRVTELPTNFDPHSYIAFAGYPFEPLFTQDWTLDRNIYDFKSDWTPNEYYSGLLAENWEWPDPQTMIIHIRQGVHWQDKPPVNGREFTAHDVAYHYSRMLGQGGGFTEPSPFYKGWISGWEKATALDDYTVEFKFKNPTIIVNVWSMFMPLTQFFEAPESVEQGLLTDWKDCVGTGAYILTDYVQGASMTLNKNPNYWGKDERHPENQLPYIDEVKVLLIPDPATAISALRTGKIDYLSNLNWQQAKNLSKSNPELQQSAKRGRNFSLHLRCDNKPFTDIKVRKALQLSLDLETIAKTHYGGTVSGEAAGIISPTFTGYTIPYAEWPEELKEEYSYNPTKAKQFLSEAGYPDGFKTNCLTISSFDLELMQIIKAYFYDIGVDMEIKVADFGTAFAMARAFKHDQIFAWMSCAGLEPMVAMENTMSKVSLLRHNDKNFDAIVEGFRVVSSEAEAQQQTIAADMYFLKSHWTVELPSLKNYDIIQPYVKGYSGESALASGMLGSFYWARFSIDSDLKK